MAVLLTSVEQYMGQSKQPIMILISEHVNIITKYSMKHENKVYASMSVSPDIKLPQL